MMSFAVALVTAIAVAWTFSATVRTHFKWFALSERYKSEVAALPVAADGYLKHIEWDGWGFSGAGNTVVYLVSDPTNTLASLDGRSGRVSGIPCEVAEVHRLEPGWYTALFFTDTEWAHCA